MDKKTFVRELFSRSLAFTIDDEPKMLILEMEDDKWVDAVLATCESFALTAEELGVLDDDPRMIEMVLNSMSFLIKQDARKFLSFGTDGVLAKSILTFIRYAFGKLKEKGLYNDCST